MTTPPRKRGRPKLDRPPKLARRPKAIQGGKVVKAVMPPETILRLNHMAGIMFLTPSAMLRRLVDQEFDRTK